MNALNKRRKEWTPTDSTKQNFVVPLALLVKKDHLHFDRKEDLNDIKSEQVNHLDDGETKSEEDLNDIKSEQVNYVDDGETKSEEFYLQTIEALVTEAYTHYPNSENLKVLQTALHKSSPLSHHTPPSPFSLLLTPPVKKTESQEEGHKKRESPLVLEEQPKSKRPRGRPYGVYDPYAKINPRNVKMVSRAKNRWKCTLKDGIMHINNRDILFNKASGEFDF